MVTHAENHTSHSEGSQVTQAERTGAIRAGWNDAAWGRARRPIADRLTRWYELGYAGGLVFRHRVELAARN